MQTVIVEVRVEVQTLSLFGVGEVGGGGDGGVGGKLICYIHCINGFGS